MKLCMVFGKGSDSIELWAAFQFGPGRGLHFCAFLQSVSSRSWMAFYTVYF